MLRDRPIIGASVFLAFCAVVAAGALFDGNRSGRAVAAAKPGYVTAANCKGCHEDAYAAWVDSHHGWAMRNPSAENVLGDFDNAKFEHAGVTSRFYRRDGRYFVESQGTREEPSEFEIKFTVGVAPLQQYLIELDRGRLQALDVAWDVARKQWYHLYPNQTLVPGDGLHWTGPYKNWQARCAECHQTNFVKAYDPHERSYASTWSDLTVACEACHGPGEAHVSWAADQDTFDPTLFAGVDDKGLTLVFTETERQPELQLCGRCHSRREPLGADSPPPSDALADHYNLALLRQGLYHADGQIDDEVYVFGSFLQSKMYEKGVRCTDCHEPHSGELKADGNGVCTQCHNTSGNADFPTLKPADYEAREHHHHEADTPGAQCVSCHMPAKNYMVIDPRRDHSFRVPRPDLTVKLGTPNACTGCHSGQTTAWAAEQIREWYPEGRSEDPHRAEAFAKARAGDFDASLRSQLVAIAIDTSRPAIARATALDHLQQAADVRTLDQLTGLLGDDSELVRVAATRLFRAAPAEMRYGLLLPLIEDTSKSVRIAAAREFLNIPAARMPAEDRAKVSAAIREFQASLVARADFPEIQMSLAGLALTTRNLRAAESALREALGMDPHLADAWHLLARVQLAGQRSAAARDTLKDALAALPEAGPLHHLMGGVLTQLGELGPAVTSFRRAAELMPGDATTRVDLAAVLTRLNRHSEASPVIAEAIELAPDEPDALALLATNRLKLGRIKEARDVVRQLVQRHPTYRLTPELNALLALPQ